MRYKTQYLAVGLTLGLAGFGTLAQASLMNYTSQGVGLVYEDYGNGTGLTWTANANLAHTESFGVSGITTEGAMTWDVAQNWIAAMNIANYGGFNDWRLWSALNLDGSAPTFGPNANNELGHLFYTEGGLNAGNEINSSTVLNDHFFNIHSRTESEDLFTGYWSGTIESSTTSWGFTYQGYQYPYGNSNGSYANNLFGWAVRSEQVSVPLPATGWLAALGLMLLGRGSGALKLKKSKQ